MTLGKKLFRDGLPHRGTVQALRQAIMSVAGVRFVLLREATAFVLGDKNVSQDHIREVIDQARPLGGGCSLQMMTDDELHSMITDRDELIKAQAAIITRYEELAPDLKAADSTLEILKKEADELPNWKTARYDDPVMAQAIAQMSLTVNERRAAAGLPRLPGFIGDTLLVGESPGKSETHLGQPFLAHTHDSIEAILPSLDGDMESGE